MKKFGVRPETDPTPYGWCFLQRNLFFEGLYAVFHFDDDAAGHRVVVLVQGVFAGGYLQVLDLAQGIRNLGAVGGTSLFDGFCHSQGSVIGMDGESIRFFVELGLVVLDELLDMKQIGISLTENGAMYPHASVCGLMFSHPASEYFSVGKIGEDQLEDYARRRGKSIEEMCKFLAANLQ